MAYREYTCTQPLGRLLFLTLTSLFHKLMLRLKRDVVVNYSFCYLAGSQKKKHTPALDDGYLIQRMQLALVRTK